ncbi:MAG: hypothetical protein GY940_07800 [bacterium]|nr:hypothetical protein [bacterium]
MKKTNIYSGNSQFLRFLILSAVVTVFVFSFNPAFADNIKTYEARVREIPLDFELNNIQKIVSFKGAQYILDTGNHRIAVARDGKMIDQIGMIGNNKGDLYYPADFYIDGKSTFYLVERGNRRIQILDYNGGYVAHFPDRPMAFGIAVDSRGNIYLGRPQTRKLVSVYDSTGKKLTEFGDLIKPSDIYGAGYKEYDENYELPMNRVYMIMDGDDRLWIGFYHLPLVCKFDRSGKLLDKKIIALNNLERLKKAVWEPASYPEYLSFGHGRAAMALMIKDFVYETKSKRIYVLLGDNRILVLNSRAKEEFVIKPRIIKGAIEKICVTETGEILASFFFSPKLYKIEKIVQ